MLSNLAGLQRVALTQGLACEDLWQRVWGEFKTWADSATEDELTLSVKLPMAGRGVLLPWQVTLAKKGGQLEEMPGILFTKYILCTRTEQWVDNKQLCCSRKRATDAIDGSNAKRMMDYNNEEISSALEMF
jgi:hypothetical protein